MKMSEQHKHIFGPVPSRRLGLSLGIDLVPLKTCTQNCIYCQLGINGKQTLQRKPYVDIDSVLDELKERVSAGLHADYITLSGSGEPTLNSEIGKLIDGIKKITDIPIAIITNGTLFNIDEVRKQCAKADIVLPSLDAGDEKTFQKMNCPATGIRFVEFVDGLCRFRADYNGQMWLEAFFCQDVNTSPKQINDMVAVVQFIAPDRVQLNTAVRPTADSHAKRVPADKLEAIAKQFGDIAEVVADYSKTTSSEGDRIDSEDIMEMLKRRPCSIDDICAGLQITPVQATPIVEYLHQKDLIATETRNTIAFYKAK